MNAQTLLHSTAVVVCMAALGCGVPDPPAHAKRTPKPGKADLPGVPDLSPPLVPDKYPDGAWSVHGLLATDRKTLPPSLQVRGYVAALNACPLTEQACKPAPHLYLSDEEKGTGRRLLVGGERDLDRRGWKVGQQIAAQGGFASASADGVYFAPAGLLLLEPLPPPVDAAP
ncbi:MAG: hypothetical protein FJ100_02305 [Deltaproteobacteria bacterium]|nr:hypothetical protein [Deltaproteobacteria bacterium]